MDELKTMRVFARVAGEGSFAGAARALDLAPAVVTRAVAELEGHLGARLLNRTTRKVVLTEVGTDYLARVQRILADVDEAQAMAGAHVQEARGLVRLLVPPAISVHQIAKHLPRFYQRHPLVQLEVDAFGPVTASSEAHDISIVWTRDELSGEFIARRLARTETIVCAAPDYLARHGRPQHPLDLEQHVSLLPPTSAIPQGLTFRRRSVRDEGLAGEEVTLHGAGRTVLRSAHIDTNYAAALAGLGIAGLPSYVVEDALMEHALERLLPDWHLFSATIWATMPSRQHLPARTRAVLDFLLGIFGGEDRDPWLAAAGCETVGA
jgi:DNA-binding transcriptional LysR family regulator